MRIPTVSAEGKRIDIEAAEARANQMILDVELSKDLRTVQAKLKECEAKLAQSEADLAKAREDTSQAQSEADLAKAREDTSQGLELASEAVEVAAQREPGDAHATSATEAELTAKLLAAERAVKAKDVDLKLYKDEVAKQEDKYASLLALHKETEQHLKAVNAIMAQHAAGLNGDHHDDDSHYDDGNLDHAMVGIQEGSELEISLTSDGSGFHLPTSPARLVSAPFRFRPTRLCPSRCTM